MRGKSESTQGWMRIKELAVRAGVSRYTIHYYLREDLLPPPLKTGRTMALYSTVHLDCLRLVREMREEQGMSIAEVRQEVRIHFGDQWRLAKSASSLDGRSPGIGRKGKLQRQRIIDAAVDLFTRQGYHGTHISHIAGALRIAKGTFYDYFENKNDLLAAIFDQMVQERDKSEEALSKEPNPVNRALERGRAFFRFFQKYHRILLILREIPINQNGRSELGFPVIYQKLIRQTAADVVAAREQGLVPDTKDDPELMAQLTFGAVDFMSSSLLRGDSYSFEEILRPLARMFGIEMLGAVDAGPK